MTIFVRHSTTSFLNSTLSALSIWRKKTKHLCSQCCLPIGRVRRQWARSVNLCESDQRVLMENESENKTWAWLCLKIIPGKLHQAHLRWLNSFQMSIFSQMKLYDEDLSPYLLSRLLALVLSTGQHTSMSINLMWLNLFVNMHENNGCCVLQALSEIYILL